MQCKYGLDEPSRRRPEVSNLPLKVPAPIPLEPGEKSGISLPGENSDIYNIYLEQRLEYLHLEQSLVYLNMEQSTS